MSPKVRDTIQGNGSVLDISEILRVANGLRSIAETGKARRQGGGESLFESGMIHTVGCISPQGGVHGEGRGRRIHVWQAHATSVHILYLPDLPTVTCISVHIFYPICTRNKGHCEQGRLCGTLDARSVGRSVHSVR